MKLVVPDDNCGAYTLVADLYVMRGNGMMWRGWGSWLIHDMCGWIGVLVSLRQENLGFVLDDWLHCKSEIDLDHFHKRNFRNISILKAWDSYSCDIWEIIVENSLRKMPKEPIQGMNEKFLMRTLLRVTVLACYTTWRIEVDNKIIIYICNSWI